jgi:hypothetical protein
VIAKQRTSMYVMISLCCLHSMKSHADEANKLASTRSDVTEIYATFLQEWSGKNQSTFNLAKSADSVPENGINQEFYSSGCGGIADVRKLPSYSTSDLSYIVKNLPHIHVIDPRTWRPVDPSVLISNGQAVGSAVERAYSSGLMTLSSVTFDEQHDVAIFAYTFMCGSLCGNGGVVIFHKTAKGWIRDKKDCVSWVS